MNTSYTMDNDLVTNELFSKALRLSTSASLGVLVTGMLLLLMCSLIAMEVPDIDTESIKITEIIMQEDRTIEPLSETKLVKPVDPHPVPKMPKIEQSFDHSEGLDIAMVAPTIEGGLDVAAGFTTGSAMAIFKVAPQYPRRLLTRGVEGFVDLVFDITPTGKTENIRVVYSQPQGAFDRSAVKALEKWKYNPAMDDGIAMAQKNQTTRITYELEE